MIRYPPRPAPDRSCSKASPSVPLLLVRYPLPRARLIGALSHRDFIYVVVLLSAFGRAHWFLVATAVGTPVFLALALVFLRTDGRVP